MLSVIVEPPSGAVIEPVRPGSHVVVTLAGSAIVTPAGKLSVNDNPVTGDAEPLVIVKVIVLTDPGPIVLGVNTFVMVG